MVNLIDHLGAIRGQDPLAQVGGLALDFVAKMVPSPVGLFLVLSEEGGYSLVTVRADPILAVEPDRIGRDFLGCMEVEDPFRSLLYEHPRTNLFEKGQFVFDDERGGTSGLNECFFDPYELGPGIVLAMWDQASTKHCLLMLARSAGEMDFSDREKIFLRHAAPLLTQSYHCAIGMGGLVAPLPGTVTAMLTPRELQIAVLAAHGSRNSDIARDLNIAPGTVKSHMHSIYAKLGVTSRVYLALALGLSN